MMIEKESLEILPFDLAVGDKIWVAHVNNFGDCYVYQVQIVRNKHFITPIQDTKMSEVRCFNTLKEARLMFSIANPEKMLFEIDSSFFSAFFTLASLKKKMRRIQ